MKKILYLLGCLLVLASCSPEYTLYSGPEYLQFSDTLKTLPVMNDTEVFNIPVAATTRADHDRTMGIEILDNKSNAVEGRHFQLESTTVTIPAGEMATNVRLKGFASNITYGDSLRLTLRLVTPEDKVNPLSGNETAIMLEKCCPFDIHQFEGWAIMTSTFLMQYALNSQKLVKIEVDPTEENTLILRDYFYEGYDCRIKLDASDPLNPIATVEDNQVFSGTSEAFGTIYGDGKIIMTSPYGYQSYFSPCQRYIAHFMYLSVESVGNVGLFLNIMEMITDEQAEQYRRKGL